MIPVVPVDSISSAGLGEIAAAEHARLQAELRQQQRLTSDCQFALEGAAKSYELAAQCTAAIERDGMSFKTDRGIAKHPLLTVRGVAMCEYERWLGELGLTPASRRKVAANEAKPLNDLDAFKKEFCVVG